MEPILTEREMRVVETATAESGLGWDALIERAGAQVARQTIAWVGPGSTEHVLVLAGPGNNGGDALIAARHLHDHGWQVECYTWSRASDNDDKFQGPLRERRTAVVPLPPGAFAAELHAALARATLVLDGLLGIGLKRDVAGELAEIIDLVSRSSKPVVAVDIPTGVDSDTGAVRGVALKAVCTVTLGHYKYGHFLTPGSILSGKTLIGEIGLKETGEENYGGGLLDDECVTSKLPQRPADAHKGTFGKAMIVAGSVNYIGAATLAAQGALRVGAGLVTLGCAGDLLSILAAKVTEATFLPLPSDLGVIATRAEDKLRHAVKDYNSLLIGCGIGREKETVGFLRGMLAKKEPTTRSGVRRIGFAVPSAEDPKEEDESAQLPALILDGDALSIISEWNNWYELVPQGSVLTPHPGEMARLLGSTTEEVQKNRAEVARDSAAKWKQIVVLKGAGTIIASPEGKVYVSPFSNPALATAGTGDVLAGTIAGLIAQGLTPVDAACVGVYLHGMAGEMLRDEYGPSGGLSGDLPVLVARAVNRLRSGKGGSN